MDDDTPTVDLRSSSVDLLCSEVAAFALTPYSASEARHFVAHTLRTGAVDPDVIDSVELVTSELVTNAVLHAHTGPTVTISSSPHCVRLEVRDASTSAPVASCFEQDSPTGHGLSVVGRAASNWGYDTDQFGKTVWAEFLLDHSNDDTEECLPVVHTELIVDTRMSSNTKLIEFKNVPVNLYIDLEQATDAIVREFELLAIYTDSQADNVQDIHSDLAAFLVKASNYFSPVKARFRSQMQRAKERGAERVDLRVYLDNEGVAFLQMLTESVDQADELSDRGILLTSSSPLDVRALRSWLNDEAQNQFAYSRPPQKFHPTATVKSD